MLTAFLGFLALATGGQSATLDQLRQLVKSDRQDRFEEIVRFVETAPNDADALSAMGIFNDAVNDLDRRVSKIPYIPTEEFNAKRALIEKPFEPYRELCYVSAETAKELVRQLYTASPAQRSVLLKKLAEAASDDWPIKDDEVYFGPYCGTYDHTNESKIEWAARRYQPESVAVLKQPKWNGRRYMIIALSDYGRGLRSPEFGEVLRDLANDPNTLVRGQAILELSHYPGPDTDAILANALLNKAADTRAKAIVTAGALKIRSLEPAVTTLVDDPVHAVVEQAIGFMGQIATPTAKATLLRCLQRKLYLWPTLEAVTASKCKEAVPYIVRMLGGHEYEGFEKGFLLATLVKLDRSCGEDEVERALKSSDEDFLLIAINLAGDLKLERTRSTLQRLAKGKDEYFRSRVISALKALDTANETDLPPTRAKV